MCPDKNGGVVHVLTGNVRGDEIMGQMRWRGVEERL